MEHSEPLSIMASDGRRLAADLFRPQGPVRAQVILHGATAVPRGYYAPFAQFLANAGFETLIYDYRGVGGSVAGSARDDDATMSDWLTLDAPAAVRALRGSEPPRPVLRGGPQLRGPSRGGAGRRGSAGSHRDARRAARLLGRVLACRTRGHRGEVVRDVAAADQHSRLLAEAGRAGRGHARRHRGTSGPAGAGAATTSWVTTLSCGIAWRAIAARCWP
jgi:hypothetical protein